MPAHLLLSAVVAAAFALIHLSGPKLGFMRATPRSIWLSAAGGVSVAYVFVHLLPELAAFQKAFTEHYDGAGLLGSIERHSYVIALTGLSIFYGLDRVVRTSARGRKDGRGRTGTGVFWVHLGSFAVYNLLIGYLLAHREEGDVGGLLIYGFAMGLHFVVNDQALREQHGRLYDGKGRWLLAAAPLAGWASGLATSVPDVAVSALFAFLAGGVVLNVLKEELPEDRESRFWAFAAGAAAYAALLLATE